jgi:hypothetical protein
MARLTIGEGAELLEKVEIDLPANYFARQLRGFVQRGLLGNLDYRGHGRTAAALLGEHEICLARLLSVMSRIGLQPEQLHAAARCRNNVPPPVLGLPRPEGYPGNFGEVINAIRAGAQWFFVLKIGPWSSSEDPAVGDVRGGFYQKPDFEQPDFSYHAVLALPCSDLLGPLLQHLGESPSSPETDDDADDLQE